MQEALTVTPPPRGGSRAPPGASFSGCLRVSLGSSNPRDRFSKILVSSAVGRQSPGHPRHLSPGLSLSWRLRGSLSRGPPPGVPEGEPLPPRALAPDPALLASDTERPAGGPGFCPAVARTGAETVPRAVWAPVATGGGGEQAAIVFLPPESLVASAASSRRARVNVSRCPLMGITWFRELLLTDRRTTSRPRSEGRCQTSPGFPGRSRFLPR